MFDLAGIFGAGLLTMVTPCVLPLVPIYLALLVGGATADGTSWRGRLAALGHTSLFALGLTLVFVALGLTATSFGRLLTAHRSELVIIGGLLIFLFGLKLLGVLRVGWLDREQRLEGGGAVRTRLRWLNALMMGAVFALGWSPCIGPILGSVLTYTASTASSPLHGALYLATYAAGLVLPLLVFSLFAAAARRVVRRLSRWMPRLERATGLLLAVVGLVLMLDVSNPPPATASPISDSSSVAAPVDPPLGVPTPRPRMVAFTSASCSICRQMIPTVAVIDAECGGKNVDVVKVDLAQRGGQRLAGEYQVRGVPTYVFLAADGSVAARLVGYQPLASLRQSLATVVGERCAGVGDPSGGLRPAPRRSQICAAGGGAAACEDRPVPAPPGR